VKFHPKSAFRRPITWLRVQSSSFRDVLWIFLLAAPAFWLWSDVNGFEVLYRWSRLHEDIQLDELFLLAATLGVAAIVYSVRRVLELRREIARREEAEREAHRLAHHDALTGLPNRRQFVEDFRSLTERLAETEVCALFVVDLDHFKPVNDLHGHRLGDEVLRVVGQRLSKLVDGSGIVARLGGDEFGILLVRARDDEAPSRLARQIVYEIPKPITLAALEIVVGVSLGISIYDPQDINHSELRRQDGGEMETVLRQADMAMYRAKTEGRSRYHFFDRGMDEKLQERVELEREIKSAIGRGEIVPYYQPLVDLSSQCTIGFEVLARWDHPTRGILHPSVFIPIAEDTGAIAELTYALLVKATNDAKSWPHHFLLSLNLSARQFADPWLAQRILAILTKSGFPPHQLEIEITETAVVDRLEEAKSALSSLRNLGVRIALDDFGTGYAGLFHLRELPLDTIKIDRSFVTHMLETPEGQKIVEAMISLGHSFGLQTMAEGIETKDVLERLTRLGCDSGQGFLLGKPEAIAETGQGKVILRQSA
jgi:diguanylate cyclase (GGDEF)-like protein